MFCVGFVWLVVVSLYVLVACMLFYVCFLSMRWFVVVWQLFKCCVRRCCCAARVLFRLCSWQCVLLLLLRVCCFLAVSVFCVFLFCVCSVVVSVYVLVAWLLLFLMCELKLFV